VIDIKPSLSRARAYVGMGFQDAVEHRADYLFQSMTSLFPLLADALVWVALFRATAGGTVGDYDLPRLLGYVVAAKMALAIVRSDGADLGIAQEIRDGTLSAHLLRPVSSLARRFWVLASKKAARVSWTVLIYSVVFALFPMRLGVALTGWRIGAFALSLVLGTGPAFFTDYLTGTSSFLLLEISAVFFVKNWVVAFLAGEMIPVDLLPGWLEGVARALPFRYLVYFPARILVGMASGAEIWAGLIAQGIWVPGLSAAVGIAWNRGVRRNEAVGS
jgi:ABC-2 type transport system permease protein